MYTRERCESLLNGANTGDSVSPPTPQPNRQQSKKGLTNPTLHFRSSTKTEWSSSALRSPLPVPCSTPPPHPHHPPPSPPPPPPQPPPRLGEARPRPPRQKMTTLSGLLSLPSDDDDGRLVAFKTTTSATMTAIGN